MFNFLFFFFLVLCSWFKVKVPDYRLEIVAGKWQGNCAYSLDSRPLSIAATFSRPGRIEDLLCAAPFPFSVPVSTDSKRTPPLVCARLSLFN